MKRKKIVLIISGCVECCFMPHPMDADMVCCHPITAERYQGGYPSVQEFFYEGRPDWCPLPDCDIDGCDWCKERVDCLIREV